MKRSYFLRVSFIVTVLILLLIIDTAYFDEKLSQEELKNIISKLGIETRTLLRKNENDYKENNLDNPNLTDEELVELMLRFPKLMERPIVVKGEQAVIGRPPENVLELILKGE